MAEKPVTAKLEKMNVSKNMIEDNIATYEKQLESRKQQITSMNSAIKQLEAEANSLVGSIGALKVLLQDTSEDETSE